MTLIHSAGGRSLQETERQRYRNIDRQREGERERKTDRQRQRKKDREREKETDRQTDRQREKERTTERQRKLKNLFFASSLKICETVTPMLLLFTI